MNREDAIKRASELAFEKDANMVIGLVNDDWVIAHEDDFGRQAYMTCNHMVTSEGLKKD